VIWTNITGFMYVKWLADTLEIVRGS